MKKNKIYIVTYYKDNYGSFLQCFATYKFLEKMGYQCVVLDCYDRRPLIILKKAIITGLKFIFCPAYLKNYILMHKAGRIDANLIDEQTKLKIDEAISNQFNLEILDEKELKGLNTQDDILAFIAGSDQLIHIFFSICKIVKIVIEIIIRECCDLCFRPFDLHFQLISGSLHIQIIIDPRILFDHLEQIFFRHVIKNTIICCSGGRIDTATKQDFKR